jgi:putative ABC transport system permease protein
VISNTLWRRLGADRQIVGQGITLNDRPLTITGVMPSGFLLPVPGFATAGDQSEVWLYLDPLGRGQDLGLSANFGYARLKPGVALGRAEADVKRAAAEIAKLDPVSHPSYTGRLDDLHEITISGIRPTLLLLFAAAGLLLLLTCTNVAGLLLARAVARARETATRVALGASRSQLALQYFVEGLFLSVAGAAISALLSLAVVRSVVSMAAAYIPRADEIAIDWRVFFFAIGTAFAASALSSLAPLWQAVRTEPGEVLSAGVRASAGARVRRLSQSLVVAEIALAFALLAVSATLIVHLRDLSRISPGFDPDQVLTFALTIPDTISSSDAARAPYQTRLTEALERIPGVSGAAFVNHLPLDGCCLSTTIHPEGRTTNPDSVERTSFNIISPSYFGAMRISLRSGRFLTEADTSKDLVFAMINQAAAGRYWPDRNPVGAYGHFLSPSGDRFQIVGVCSRAFQTANIAAQPRQANRVRRIARCRPEVFCSAGWCPIRFRWLSREATSIRGRDGLKSTSPGVWLRSGC